MPILELTPGLSAKKIYASYIKLFLALLFITTIIDSVIYNFRLGFSPRDLFEIFNFTISVSLVAMGLIALTLRAVKQVPYSTVWVLLALAHGWFLSQATSVALGAAGYLYLAAHEQLLYSGPPEPWQLLGISILLYTMLPLAVAYGISSRLHLRTRSR